MNGFAQSRTGRLMALSFGIALIGGGASALIAAPASLYLMSLSVITAIALNIVGLPDALEDFPFEVVLSAIVLPVALFLFATALGVITLYYPKLGFVLVAAGMGSLGLAARPRPSETNARSELRRPSGEQAHAAAR